MLRNTVTVGKASWEGVEVYVVAPSVGSFAVYVDVREPMSHHHVVVLALQGAQAFNCYNSLTSLIQSKER